jgi:hypothetical protein
VRNSKLFSFGFFWATKVMSGLGGEVTPPGNDLERGFTLCCSVLSLLVAGKQIGSFF